MPFILEEHTSWVDTPRNSWKEMLIFKENPSRDYLPWDLDQGLPISMTSLAPSFPVPTACHPPMLIPHHLPTISHRPNNLNCHHLSGGASSIYQIGIPKTLVGSLGGSSLTSFLLGNHLHLPAIYGLILLRPHNIPNVLFQKLVSKPPFRNLYESDVF